MQRWGLDGGCRLLRVAWARSSEDGGEEAGLVEGCLYSPHGGSGGCECFGWLLPLAQGQSWASGSGDRGREGRPHEAGLDSPNGSSSCERSRWPMLFAQKDYRFLLPSGSRASLP